MERIFTLIAIMAVGWLMRQFGILRHEDTRPLGRIVIMAGFPSLIIMSLNGAKLDAGMARILFPALLTPLLLCGLAWAIGRALKLERKALGAFILVSAFGNTGFLGLPLTIKLLGGDHLPQSIIYDTFSTGVVVWVLGLTIAAALGTAGKEKKVPWPLVLPPFIGLAIGLAVSGRTLPPILADVLNDMAASIIPLIMVSIGITLHDARPAGAWREVSLATALKLGASPAIAVLLSRVVSLDGLSAGSVLLQSAMPTALITTIIGGEYELSPDIMTGTVVATTALAMVTTPLYLRLFA